MTTTNELRAGILALARRSVSIMTACSNEESTKLYLVLPFLNLLGYDITDPYEVYPQRPADLDPASGTKIDFAVLRNGAPAMAVDCLRTGSSLAKHRGRLRTYFNALPEVKLGVLTNGTLFELFVDSGAPGTMDENPFLTVDLETIARAGVRDEIVEALHATTRSEFDPETIAEAAHVQIVKQRLRTFFTEQAKIPSEDFCRFVLERIGVSTARTSVIERYYAPLIRTAFDESLVVPLIERLRTKGTAGAQTAAFPIHQFAGRAETAERHLEIIARVRQRLAYLADNETMLAAVENVRCKDYVGKLAVFYDSERSGHLFDYIEGSDGYDKFVFPEPIGAIVTNNLADIDTALKAVFGARARDLSNPATTPKRCARVA